MDDSTNEQRELGAGLSVVGDVYILVSRTGGKGYVGVTTKGVTNRVREHVLSAARGSTYPIHRAIRKYGEDDFEVTVLESYEGPVEGLYELEKVWIQEKGTFGSEGYNATLGGEGSLGHVGPRGIPKSSETKRRMSEAARNRSESTRCRMSEVRKGKGIPLEVREKIRGSLLGRKLSDDHRRNIAESMDRPDVRSRMSESHRRENLSDETLRKMSIASSRPVVQSTVDGVVVCTYPTVNAAAEAIGVTGAAISHVLVGRNRTCGGYVWRYASEEERGERE